MDNVTITLNVEGLQDVPELNIQVSVRATVNVKANTARRYSPTGHQPAHRLAGAGNADLLRGW